MTVNDVQVTGYILSISTSELNQITAGAGLPSVLQPFRGLSLSSLSAQVYIDHSGRVIEDLVSIVSEGPQPETVTVGVEFSGYGVPVSVRIPPPGAVVSYPQLKKDLGSGQSVVV